MNFSQECCCDTHDHLPYVNYYQPRTLIIINQWMLGCIRITHGKISCLLQVEETQHHLQDADNSYSLNPEMLPLLSIQRALQRRGVDLLI